MKMMADVTTQCRDISELTPAAQRACRLFLERCAQRGLDVFITETYRSQERQDYLYSLGRTRSGSKVTWTRNSRHTSRRAWDIACRGGTLYNAVVLAQCGAVAAELGITWGGTWKTPDTPHFEVSENWNYSEEDVNMEELKGLEEKVGYIDESLTNLYSITNRLAEKERVYRTVDEVPEWARDDIKELVDSGVLKGESGGINLTQDMIRILVIIKRMLD